MTSSANSSKRPLRRLPKGLLPAFLLISFIGFLDALYLTIRHYSQTPLPCSIHSAPLTNLLGPKLTEWLSGCGQVTTSQYATFGGLPVALLGSVYYLTIFLLATAYIDTGREGLLTFTAWLTTLGLIASIWFISLQLFVLKALCPYCLLSALTSILLFVLGLFVLRHKDKKSPAGVV